MFLIAGGSECLINCFGEEFQICQDPSLRDAVTDHTGPHAFFSMQNKFSLRGWIFMAFPFHDQAQITLPFILRQGLEDVDTIQLQGYPYGLRDRE